MTLAVAGAAAPAGAQTNIYQRLMNQSGREFFDTHGYLPVDGVRAFYQQKERAALAAAQHAGTSPAGASGSSAAPIIGASWQGIASSLFSPPDPNGAIGPNGYGEIINSNIALYTRTGSLVVTQTLSHLTNHTLAQLSDPMMLWDPHTQRFYFLVWNVSNATMDWGFSKDDNPQNLDSNTASADWCSYETGFGYQTTNLPDYPKLGQSKFFLMIGVNFYPSFSNLHATQSDLLWIQKLRSPAPITNCPAATSFNSGKFEDLRNEDGTQAFTPVPTISTDTSKVGLITTMSDIECPDICGSGNLITVHELRPTPGNPSVAEMTVTGHSVTVNSFSPPPDAPQKNGTFMLDTLDGRLTHADMNITGLDLDDRCQQLLH